MNLNKNFYSFAIFLWAVFSIITGVQGIVYFFLGQQVYALKPFLLWYLFSHVLFLLGMLILIRYFYSKKYRLPFWITIVAVIASSAQFIIVSGVLTGLRELQTYYPWVQLAVVGTWILYGLSLLFSDARKRHWLKVAAVFYLVLGLFIMATDIWYLKSDMVRNFQTFELILKTVSLISFIGPLLIMMNFISEEKQVLPEAAGSPSPGKMETLQAATKLIAVLLTIFLSLKMTVETASKISWERRLKMQATHWEKVSGSRTFTQRNGDTLRYQLLKPENFDSTKKYPMVVCLPYGGGVEGSPPAQLLLKEENRKKYPAFLFVPFCPNGSGWGGIPNYPTMDTIVFQAIEHEQLQNSPIDVDRVYISGVSRGGYGSWHFISLRPDLFAAAMPVCGGGDPALAPNVVSVAVWAFHGENDPNVPVSGSRDMIAAIENSGGNPKYTEFEGAGHDIWHYVTITPGVLEWMFEQRRGERRISVKR